MSAILKFLPLTKFSLHLLYFKSHIRQGPQHLLLNCGPHVASTVITYVHTNRSVIGSPTFYVTCPFIRFVALRTPFRWSLNIEKMKLEESNERVVNWASLVRKVLRKTTLWINDVCITFLYFNIPCGFYYCSFMQVH